MNLIKINWRSSKLLIAVLILLTALVIANDQNLTGKVSDDLAVQDVVSACGSLNTPNTVYELDQNLIQAGTCFIIGADNITLDCQGFNLTGNGGGDGVNVIGYDNITIKNCNIANFNLGIYLEASSGGLIDSNNASANSAGIYLASFSSNNEITNNNASLNTGMGIVLWQSSNNTVSFNTLNSNSMEGIRIDESSDNSVTHNMANSNADGMLIQTNAHSNNLSFNTVSSNTNMGIWLTSTDNILTSNEIISNSNEGIRVESNSNNITGNTVATSGFYGVEIVATSNNIIYNNFLNNTANVLLSGSSTNSWNTTLTAGTNIAGGSLIGGNFYANSSGTGFSETCIDVDLNEICDSENSFGTGNVDYLPLIQVVPAPSPSPAPSSGGRRRTFAPLVEEETASSLIEPLAAPAETITPPSQVVPEEVPEAQQQPQPEEIILAPESPRSFAELMKEKEQYIIGGIIGAALMGAVMSIGYLLGQKTFFRKGKKLRSK